MAKGKDTRVIITSECTSCTRNKSDERFSGISRYTTQKNRRNTPTRLESKKFCPYCSKKTIHRELKK
uniref:ribosomal protein L33 n=1 Tax=Todea barbara TaxID=90702 RepID=UPI0023D8948F|nr:ribosomal protein L33 [Todea barbara]WDE24638.1 ribosomal protein L33 [Todea barbara]